MTLQSFLECVLEWLLGEPAALPVSIANPDQLARPLQVEASDNVTRFIMRGKRYAALGIQSRLSDPTLPALQYSLQTLALITGRNFHREDESVKLTNAKQWLAKQSK